MAVKTILIQIKQTFCYGLIALILSFGFIFSGGSVAIANNTTGSREAGRVVQQRAERELDRKAGAGTANQLEGQAQEGIGWMQRQFDNEVEGTAKQMEGKARKNVGRAQQATEDTANSIQESAESLMDRVKDFVGQ